MNAHIRHYGLDLLKILGLLTGLYLSKIYNYLLFHSLVEMFVVFVAGGIFIIIWNTRQMIQNPILRFLGIAYLFIGLFHALHLLAYKGMPIFYNSTPNLPTQLWIAGQFLCSISVWAAFYLPVHKISPPLTLGGYTLTGSLLLIAIFTGNFPACYIEGEGLTWFKKSSEIVIMLLLLSTFPKIWSIKKELEAIHVEMRDIQIFVLFSILAELAFSVYTDVYDLFNMGGHILKLIATISLYKSVVESSLRNPYKVIFQDLFLNREKLREQNLHLKKTTDELQESQQFVQSTLDSLIAQIAILDASGTIRAVNTSWKQFADENNLGWVDYGLGRNYLLVCDNACPPWDEEAASTATGIRRLIANEIPEFSVEYPCHAPLKKRWFTMHATRFQGPQGIYVVIAHENITDRKLSEEALAQKALELSIANAEMEDFTRIASHDLQEPLRKIRIFGERLENRAGERLDIQELDYLKRMQNAAQRMQQLIDELLLYTQITTQAQPLVPVQLTPLIEELLVDLEIPIAETGGKIEISELPTVIADPGQMRRLFQNLIGNALKFHRPNTPPHIEIAVHPAQNPEKVQIVVADNGIGFDEKYLDRIFQPFQRLHTREEFAGVGMGLSICHKIVERHAGAITAHSIPGQGSRFIITLPAGHIYTIKNHPGGSFHD